MSVLVSKRHQSKVEFIDNSRELLIHTLHCVKKFPKSVTFYLSQDVVKFARDSYTKVVRGNHVYPDTVSKYELKMSYIQGAYDDVVALSSLISIMFDIYKDCLTDYGWEHWGDLINKEKILLSGLLKTLKPINQRP